MVEKLSDLLISEKVLSLFIDDVFDTYEDLIDTAINYIPINNRERFIYDCAIILNVHKKNVSFMLKQSFEEVKNGNKE